MVDTLVIYHGNCFDGFTAAWVFYNEVQQNEEYQFEKVEYLGAKFGENPPDVSGKYVYILDFSYPRAVLEKMYNDANHLIVLDHHKSAEADLKDLDYCIFDMERSGAGMTWDYLTGNKERPWLVNIVEDRDLWRFKYGWDTKYASAYIAALPMTFDEWDLLNEDGLEYAIEKGESIRKYIDNYGETACNDVIYRDIAGYRVPVINVSYQNCSDHLDVLLKKHDNYPFVASFFMRGDGKYQFSLRSREDFDVSKIAKIFGGGGHIRSAGFEVKTLPWDM